VAADTGHVEAVADLAAALQADGYTPVLVGGMALVVLGSPRVTKDFDFLVSSQGRAADPLVMLMYRHGLELVTKLNAVGEVIRTVDNARVAAARVKADKPRSIFFFNAKSGLRVDLLIDYPVPAQSIVARSVVLRLKRGTLRVAAPEDLLQLKEIAYADRKAAADGQDLEFLRLLLRTR
jgi:hypothetical protein